MNIDGFVSAFITPGLQPGEAVMGAGHLRRSTGGDYQLFDECIGVATDRRLVVFRTEVTGLGVFTVQPKNLGGVVEWWYQDLDRVGARNLGEGVISIAETAMVAVAGPIKVLSLSAYEGLRPTPEERETYLIPSSSVGLSGQAQMQAQYADWLKARVDARSFPLTPERQHFHAQRQMQRQQQQAAAEAGRQRAAAETRALTKRLAPYLLALVPLTSTLVGAAALSKAVNDLESTERFLASPAGQEPTVRATYEADRELYQGRIPVDIAWIGASLLATGGAAYWAWRHNRRAAGG